MNFLKKIGHFIYHVEKRPGVADKLVLFEWIRFRLTNRGRESVMGYLFIMIWIIGFIWFMFIPLLTSLQFSFSRVSIPGGQGIVTEFNGLSNYMLIFTELSYLQAIQGFVYQTLIYLPLVLIISMILAILLNQKIQLRGFFRTIYFLPVIIASGPVLATLLGSGSNEGLLALTSGDTITSALENLLPGVLSEFVGSLFSHMVTILWFSGVQIILFLAGLQKINKEIYEAAAIDGASPWESFWKITLPSMKPIILVSAIYTIVMLATYPNNQVLIKINQVRVAGDNGYGYGSALSWVYFLVVALLLGISAFILSYERKPKAKKLLMEVKR